ncbi:unnamed protein product [Arctogadus glacialis]
MLTGFKPNLFWQKSLRRGSSAVAGRENHPERLQSLEGESPTPQPPLELLGSEAFDRVVHAKLQHLVHIELCLRLLALVQGDNRLVPRLNERGRVVDKCRCKTC